MRSLKPPEERRGHGSGRARSAAAEDARRAAISRAVRERGKSRRVIVSVGYRKILRDTMRRGRPHQEGRYGDYDRREYRIYIQESDFRLSRRRFEERVHEKLDRSHPSRAHFGGHEIVE